MSLISNVQLRSTIQKAFNIIAKLQNRVFAPFLLLLMV